MDKKAEFLRRYRASLIEEFPWASDEAKLDRFMQSAERTIRTEAKTWNHDSTVASRIWREMTGGKGKVTLKALRAL